ncbi:unnamed protein product [Mycena citricolor]|uniref:Uncharacterized protein n=1 Tax=Mycena citricolor TaxID=2018698 RepID=A0AAD2HFV0_9AGAR|nr:unnamed protein product [Mycena citricolor]CAK5276616.1 unnamed protein product [Mycena citricolor]
MSTAPMTKLSKCRVQHHKQVSGSSHVSRARSRRGQGKRKEGPLIELKTSFFLGLIRRQVPVRLLFCASSAT